MANERRGRKARLDGELVPGRCPLVHGGNVFGPLRTHLPECYVENPKVRGREWRHGRSAVDLGKRTVVDRIGGAAYDYTVEREWLARPGGLALWGTDTRVPTTASA